MAEDSAFYKKYGPTALVTGASSGIGRAFAEHLASRGLNLVLVARRAPRLEELAEDLRRDHDISVSVCPVDLSRQSAVDDIAAATDGLDIGLLVSNAGFGLKGAHNEMDPTRLDEMLAVNCRVPMQLARAFMGQLIQRGRGGILLTSSVEALMGFPYSGAYAASKAFVNGLAESLWGELQPAGIDVLALCPGSTDTEALDLQGIDKSQLDNLMSPSEVAALALDNLANGPVYIAGEDNQQLFTGLAAMPRREALLMVGETMKQATRKH